jgi:hypothetical protein
LSVGHHRVPIFKNKEAAELLIETLMRYPAADKYLLHAFVAMPNHIHTKRAEQKMRFCSNISGAKAVETTDDARLKQCSSTRGPSKESLSI